MSYCSLEKAFDNTLQGHADEYERLLKKQRKSMERDIYQTSSLVGEPDDTNSISSISEDVSSEDVKSLPENDSRSMISIQGDVKRIPNIPNADIPPMEGTSINQLKSEKNERETKMDYEKVSEDKQHSDSLYHVINCPKCRRILIDVLRADIKSELSSEESNEPQKRSPNKKSIEQFGMFDSLNKMLPPNKNMFDIIKEVVVIVLIGIIVLVLIDLLFSIRRPMESIGVLPNNILPRY